MNSHESYLRQESIPELTYTFLGEGDGDEYLQIIELKLKKSAFNGDEIKNLDRKELVSKFNNYLRLGGEILTAEVGGKIIAMAYTALLPKSLNQTMDITYINSLVILDEDCDTNNLIKFVNKIKGLTHNTVVIDIHPEDNASIEIFTKAQFQIQNKVIHPDDKTETEYLRYIFKEGIQN